MVKTALCKLPKARNIQIRPQIVIYYHEKPQKDLREHIIFTLPNPGSLFKMNWLVFRSLFLVDGLVLFYQGSLIFPKNRLVYENVRYSQYYMYQQISKNEWIKFVHFSFTWLPRKLTVFYKALWMKYRILLYSIFACEKAGLGMVSFHHHHLIVIRKMFFNFFTYCSILL